MLDGIQLGRQAGRRIPACLETFSNSVQNQPALLPLKCRVSLAGRYLVFFIYCHN